MYAEVLPNLPRIMSTFHYEVSPGLADQLQVGHLVIVPFGRQRVQGIVVSVSDLVPVGVNDFKAIEGVVDDVPVLSRCQLDLCFWISDHYCAPLIACVNLMLPPGMSKRADLVLQFLQQPSGPITARQKQLLGLLHRRGPIRGRQIDRALPRTNWRSAADQLVRKGAISRDPVLDNPTVGPRKVRAVRLAVTPQKVRAAIPDLGRASTGADLLSYLIWLWPIEPVLEDLLRSVGCEMRHVRALAARDCVEVSDKQPVVVSAVSAETSRRWLKLRHASAPRQAEVVQALVGSQDAVPIECLPHVSMSVIKSLHAQGILRYSVNPRRVRLKLTVPMARAMMLRLRRAERPVDILEYLMRASGATIEVGQVYAETGGKWADLRKLSEWGLVHLSDTEVIRDSLAGVTFIASDPPKLVEGQLDVWNRIKASFTQMEAGGCSNGPNDIRPYLIHGVTGSGKTEIYLRAVAEALRIGKRSIVLVPEIALTTQTVKRFLTRFPDRVGVMHSQLSDGERYDTWRRARAGAIDVLIGARSALFAPMPNLGLIVVDEEHDEAYRQDPPVQPPYYNARDVAIEYAQRVSAICILGSATPDIVSYRRALCDEIQLESLPERIMGHGDQINYQATRLGVSSRYRSFGSTETGEARTKPLPDVRVVDMRHELRAGHRSIFSRALLSAIGKALERGEQIILFINRRGHATYVFCRDCGVAIECSKCGIPFTFHRGPNQMICHHCNDRRRAPQCCPGCGGSRVKYFGVGTEAVESEVIQAFPGARTVRWDWDATRERGSHERILRTFSSHEADVLIGTQMIAKGLDLPLVTLVGVVSADVGLALPDYRAAERTFQVLSQVAGRAGRGLLSGRVVLQTYMPDHYAIQAAAGHDYKSFYTRELDLRRAYGYPPFTKLARLVGAQHNADRVENEANKISKSLRMRIHEERATGTSIIGPAPCFFHRVKGKHRWQLILRGPNPARLIDVPRPEGWRLEVEPLSLL